MTEQRKHWVAMAKVFVVNGYCIR